MQAKNECKDFTFSGMVGGKLIKKRFGEIRAEEAAKIIAEHPIMGKYFTAEATAPKAEKKADEPKQ